MNVFALLRPRAGYPWIALDLAAVAVLPTPAAAQAGPEIMQKHRQVNRVKDEEEQLLLPPREQVRRGERAARRPLHHERRR